MAPAHPSHHVFQPPDFVLYLGPGPGEVLENQSVRSTHHIPEFLTQLTITKLLILLQISIGARNSILLLLDAVSGFKYMQMGDIMLSQGTWEVVFETRNQIHGLCAFTSHVLAMEGWRETSFAVLGGCKMSSMPTWCRAGAIPAFDPCLRSGQPGLAQSSSKVIMVHSRTKLRF